MHTASLTILVEELEDFGIEGNRKPSNQQVLALSQMVSTQDGAFSSALVLEASREGCVKGGFLFGWEQLYLFNQVWAAILFNMDIF